MSNLVEAELIEEGSKIHEERAQTKPVKVFVIKAELADDGVFTTMFYELCQVGRKKNQKVLYRGVNEYIDRMKEVLPYCGETLEDFCQHLAVDNQVIDVQESKRIGEINITVWSDSYIQKQYVELVQADRGAPVKSVVEGSDFTYAMRQLVGSGATDALKLLK